MFKRLAATVVVFLALLFLLGQKAPDSTKPVERGEQDNLFVKAVGPSLVLDGQPYRFAGTNNYYLMYKSQYMVDDVLTRAASSTFKVLRTWGSLDIGGEDESVSNQDKGDGVYFQYWDGEGPAFNDDADGLEHLDYVVAKARELGIRLVIPLVNNWSDFGGMDQYVTWRGGMYHDQFYTDPLIRRWFTSWIAHLLNRTNTLTGVQYKDDPTIMMWELANEPRCTGSGQFPASFLCSTQTVTNWANDISTYIKTIDPHHLVSVGDEGFYCLPFSSDWTENCSQGVDTLALASLPNVDVMSFHLYPDTWGKDTAWGTQWIQRHFAGASKLGKPAVLGEFGLKDQDIRNSVYDEWTDAVLDSGGSGALYWILSGEQDDGSLYADYDGFTVYCPSTVCTTLESFSKQISGR